MGATCDAFEAWPRTSRVIGEAGCDSRRGHRVSEFVFARAVDVFGSHWFRRLGETLYTVEATDDVLGAARERACASVCCSVSACGMMVAWECLLVRF